MIKQGRIAANSDEAYNIEVTHDNVPHARIQWKGTDVCMDVYCKCGNDGHIDAMFAHCYKCYSCGTTYVCSSFIELIEITHVSENDIVVCDDE